MSTAGKSATRIRTSDELGAAHSRRGPAWPTFLQSLATLPQRGGPATRVAQPGSGLVAPLLSAGAGLPGQAAPIFAVVRRKILANQRA